MRAERDALVPWVVAAAALITFIVALLSPADLTESDPALSLLAAQAVVEHRMMSLEPYRDDPRCAYDLDTDRRLVRRGARTFHISAGASLLAVPAVWLANRFGWHMLEQEHELALQNILSALLLAATMLLLYGLCRSMIRPWPAAVVAASAVFASPLISTLSTALWNTCFEVVFLCVALWVIQTQDDEPWARSDVAMLCVFLGLAFVARPTAAFLALAVVVAHVRDPRPAVARASRVVLIALGLTLLLAWAGLLDWMPRYYSPRKVVPGPFFFEALAGVLVSPSRGLLVYCPHLVIMLAGAAAWHRRVLGRRSMKICAIWIVLHLAGVATRGMWWGGHSFGPRMLVELTPGFALLTCAVWNELRGRRRVVRRTVVVVWLILVCGSVLVHSWRGLYEPAVLRWNSRPNIDEHRELLWSWRYPQLLASREQIEQRLVEVQLASAGVYRMGERLAFDAVDLVLERFYAPERQWCWSKGSRCALRLRLGDVDRDRVHGLEMRVSTLRTRSIGVTVNGVAVDGFELRKGGPDDRLVVVPGELLEPNAVNTFAFSVPGAAPIASDLRVLGMALYSIRLAPLRRPTSVTFRDGRYLVSGFSPPEHGWRWTDGAKAEVLYPLGELGPLPLRLELVAWGHGHQRVEVEVNGRSLGWHEFDRAPAQTLRLDLAAGVLRAKAANRIVLRLPDSRPTARDSRQLGLAVVSVKITDLEPARGRRRRP